MGLAITQAIGLAGMFQWGMRQSAELENQMTSVERIVEYTNVPREGALESRPGNIYSSKRFCPGMRRYSHPRINIFRFVFCRQKTAVRMALERGDYIQKLLLTIQRRDAFRREKSQRENWVDGKSNARET